MSCTSFTYVFTGSQGELPLTVAAWPDRRAEKIHQNQKAAMQHRTWLVMARPSRQQSTARLCLGIVPVLPLSPSALLWVPPAALGRVDRQRARLVGKVGHMVNWLLNLTLLPNTSFLTSRPR